MYLKSKKIDLFGSVIAPIFFACEDSASANSDILANGNRKTVDAIRAFNAKVFHCLSQMKKQLTKQFAYLMHSSVKPTFAKHLRHQARAAHKAHGFLHISAEILGGKQHHGNDFRIVNPATIGLFVVHRFKKIVKKYVHGDGFFYHGQSCFVFNHYKINRLAMIILQ
jgi:hypothetical protein